VRAIEKLIRRAEQARRVVEPAQHRLVRCAIAGEVGLDQLPYAAIDADVEQQADARGWPNSIWVTH
jgi:hypothetical protein